MLTYAVVRLKLNVKSEESKFVYKVHMKEQVY